MDIQPENFWEAIKYKYWETIPYDWRPGQIKYRLKSYFWSKFWKVVPTDVRKDGWIDRSDLLIHYMFQILIDFIDRECSPGHVEWYGSYPHIVEVNGVSVNAMDEILELKRWWQEEYLPHWRGEGPINESLHNLEFPELDFIPTENPHLAEMKSIYKSPEHEESFKLALDKHHKLEEDFHKETIARMHRLINVRDLMWT